jgi:trehalose/maltose transport system substrate-binding protein
MPERKMGPSIFISFAEEDLKFEQELVKRLQGVGFNTWTYTHNTIRGTPIYEVLIQAIGSASAVIIVVSSHSGRSQYVIREYHYAALRRKRIIPIRLDNDNNELTFLLAPIVYVDARHGRNYMPDLQNALDNLPPPPPINPWYRRIALITKVVAVIFIVLSMVWLGWNRPLRNVLSIESIWTYILPNQPPAVPLPMSQRLTFYGDRDNSPNGKRLDEKLSKRFEIDTGIAVTLFNPKQEERLVGLNQAFADQLDNYDVVMIDTIWVGELAEHLIDLRPYFKEEIRQHKEEIISNNTIGDKLVAMPLFSDLGLLYYRTDLLNFYKQNLPETWDDLRNVAAVIQRGEREGKRDQPNPYFIGFAWQGAAYEGLSVNALEWIGSQGGLDQNTGQILDKQAVIESLDRARAWVQEGPDQISRKVNDDKEEESLQRFMNGNAAFLRAWPGIYARLKQQADKVPFDVAPLPSALGQKSVGMVGGWQLAIPKYSRNQQAAVELIRYLTSPDVQEWRATEGAYIPTIKAVFDDPQVKQRIPFLGSVYPKIKQIIRPSTYLGQNYSNASRCFYEVVDKALRYAGSKKEVESEISDMQQKPDCKAFFK